MENKALVENEWQYVLNMMPADLEESALAKLALRRRRQIGSASDLLRLALAYGACDLSLRETAAWAQLIGLGRLSDIAVLNRLKGAAEWLGHLLLRWLEERGLTTRVPPVAVRIVDATVISRPGSKGTDWRLHLGVDLASQRISTVELTGPEAGETLLRHPIQRGQIVLADRGYAQRAGAASVLDAGGHLVLRLNWQNFPLQGRAGGPLDLVSCLEILEPGEIGDWEVQFEHEGQPYPMRLVAVRKSEAAAQKEQERIRKQARGKKRRPDQRSLRAAKFTYVITDLPKQQLPTAEVLELYRLRWQIEIAFKRLKGILHFDRLRAKDPDLATSYLYAKILGALIMDELCNEALSFSPWGYPLFPQAAERLASPTNAV